MYLLLGWTMSWMQKSMLLLISLISWQVKVNSRLWVRLREYFDSPMFTFCDLSCKCVLHSEWTYILGFHSILLARPLRVWKICSETLTKQFAAVFSWTIKQFHQVCDIWCGQSQCFNFWKFGVCRYIRNAVTQICKSWVDRLCSSAFLLVGRSAFHHAHHSAICRPGGNGDVLWSVICFTLFLFVHFQKMIFGGSMIKRRRFAVRRKWRCRKRWHKTSCRFARIYLPWFGVMKPTVQLRTRVF